MIIELLADGVKTHIDLKQDCPLRDTHFERIIKTITSAARSGRDVLRDGMGSKQRTLTTRGGSNRHKLWHMTVVPEWKCPFDGEVIIGEACVVV